MKSQVNTFSMVGVSPEANDFVIPCIYDGGDSDPQAVHFGNYNNLSWQGIVGNWHTKSNWIGYIVCTGSSVADCQFAPKRSNLNVVIRVKKE